jgi:hypothetical protein
MIDGAEHFHYLGLARRNRSVMMVFQEGVLILDQDLPGWGVMRPADLARLTPRAPGHSASSGSSEEEFGSDEAAFSDSLSHDTLSTSTSHSSGSASNSASASASPRPSRSVSPSASSDDEGARPLPGWRPPESVLGWHPSEAMVHAGPVTNRAVETYKSLNGPHDVQAFVVQLKEGHWAPQPAGSPGHGTMVATQSFGELHVITWEGPWHAAGNGEHQQNGLSAARACQIVAPSVVADICSLAPVPKAELSEYRGHIEAGTASVLIFDRGLLVQAHPDPALVGWHGFGEYGRWAIVSPQDADLLQELCHRRMSKDHGMFGMFFLGDMDQPSGHGPFVALTFSHKLQQLVYLRLDAPSDLRVPGDPHGPGQPVVQQALRQMRPALVHNFHDVRGPYGFLSGAWQVPLLLGAIQCIEASVDVPGLLGTTWHDSLQPVIERQLQAHHKQESAWLASGAIKQPIDRLIDLARRDTALCCSEVWVMWPVDLLEELFKSLAPSHPARVIKAPKATDVETALHQRACTLFVFQTPGQPEQSVALAQGNNCWSGRERFSLDELKKRVAKALGNGPGEHLAALAFVV